MQSILEEIKKFHREKAMTIDLHNTNRYRLVFREADESRTAYYFSTPIYHQKNRKMVDLLFHNVNESVYAVGSNADISIHRTICMKNEEGTCAIELPQPLTSVSGKELCCGEDYIYLTTNGVAYKAHIQADGKAVFLVEVGSPFINIRANDRCIAFMAENFRPFAVFSCIGTLDSLGNVAAPAQIAYQKLTDRTYLLTVSPTGPVGKFVLFEGNLYEQKLFQDTTVESLNPDVNNAFGSTAYIGNTALYGDQWLYSRPDFSKMPELMDKHIRHAILHIPKHSKGSVVMSSFKVTARFCSFGSTWDNRIPGGNFVGDTVLADAYESLDLTALFMRSPMHTPLLSEGIILKSKIKGNGFSAVSTADSCYSPQILEIRYR